MKRKNEKNGVSPSIMLDLYEAAVLYRREELDNMEKHMRQYRGSNEIDGSAEGASTVRNITFEIIENQVSENIPFPKVEAISYSESHDDCAKVIERLCRTVTNQLPFEAMNDADERYTYIFGGSVWYVEWDSEANNGIGGVKIHCISPENLIPQPGVTDISNMEYCFLRFNTTKGEIMRRYGVSVSDLRLADCQYEFDGADQSGDTVNLVIAFYKDRHGNIGKFVFSGELVLEDLPDYYSRKREICKTCMAPRGRCNCNSGYVNEDTVYEKIFTERYGEILLPYYKPQGIPIVVRRNTLNEGSLLGASDCERIRPQQQAINKLESRILSKLLRAGITPVVPDGANIAVTNSVFGQIIRLRPGERADSYGTIDTTPNVSQDIEAADRLYDQAKRIIGISDAYQGSDSSSAESGYSRRLKISQSVGRLELKKRLKELAYSEIYRLVFEHYLAFADETRRLCYKDTLGKIHLSEFRREDFIEAYGNGYRYCNDFIFSADSSGESGYGREAAWERNLYNLEKGSLGDPKDPSTLLHYWRLQERAHYPFAKENADYFKELLAPKQNESEEQNEKQT